MKIAYWDIIFLWLMLKEMKLWFTTRHKCTAFHLMAISHQKVLILVDLEIKYLVLVRITSSTELVFC